jgi:hypothetical protein
MAFQSTLQDPTALNHAGSGHAPTTGLFVQPTQKWDATNLMFVHDINGTDYKEFPLAPPPPNPNRYEVPADNIADFTDVFMGPMPEALTLRPAQMEGCCPTRDFHIARHMFGAPVAVVKVDLPSFICLWQGGCQGANVVVENMGTTGGDAYTGELRRNMCAECLGNETTLTWNRPNKPRMVQKSPACIDTVKFNLCQPVWFGWRGTSDGAPSQDQILYDSSIILRMCDQCSVACKICTECRNSCCSKYDFAPRFARAEDLRRVILNRYDMECSFRNVKDEQSFDLEQGESAEEASYLGRLGRANNVDALFTSRLYHDVVCGKPTPVFSNPMDALHERELAIDARYRGSVRHNVVTEDDHLIVLAALVMQGVFRIPPTRGFAWNGPAYLHRGRLVPRVGGALGPGKVAMTSV